MKAFEIYLHFNGNCEEAFMFYEKVFRGKILMMNRFREMPDDIDFEFPDDELDLVMHTTLEINSGLRIMGSDTGGEYRDHFVMGNNMSISISADDHHEADRLFSELSDGGKIIMPMNETFWESYYGMLTDRFGIQWMISA